MLIDVRHADDLASEESLGEDYDLAVVVDVIRAFTVAAWVLRQGAGRLLLAPDAETAIRARDTRFPDALLMKDGAPDPHFELPNAPGSIAELKLTGKTVIQTTGNGTRGAHVVREVPVVACASFANATATARLMAVQERVLLVPTEGDEDDALADFLTARAEGRHVEMGRLLERVAESAAGVECLERGLDPAFPGFHPRDLELAQRVDVFNHAPIAQPVGDLLELKVR